MKFNQGLTNVSAANIEVDVTLLGDTN